MPRVGVVCDSTVDLGLDWFADNDVEIVPLKVQIGDETFLDWVELKPAQFYERQKDAVEMPTTSQPTPADFSAAYEHLAATGVEGIVAVTVTSALSGTYQSAEIAAADSPVPVRVVDSRLVSAATGLVGMAAVDARDAGGSLDDVADAAQWAVENIRLIFVVDTMEFLVKGGRAGRAQGLAASVLNIKPILTFAPEGIIEPFKKVKGLNKAFTAMGEAVAEAASSKRQKLMYIHAVAPDVLDQLKSAVDAAVSDYDLAGNAEIGSVIGNYGGPRTVGVAFMPAERP